MKFKVNENGLFRSPYVRDAEIEIDIENEDTLEKLKSCPIGYNWKYNFDTNSVELFELLDDEILRERRELECFTIVNRGIVWYDNLTTQQKAELSTWYKAWLDVTDTKIIPTRPNWLK